jgi:hypothetical protein
VPSGQIHLKRHDLKDIERDSKGESRQQYGAISAASQPWPVFEESKNTKVGKQNNRQGLPVSLLRGCRYGNEIDSDNAKQHP